MTLTAARLEETRIPIIDLSPFISGKGDRATTVAAVAETCERIGFLVVSGHGVEREVIAAIDHESRRFFAQPLTEKLAARPAGNSELRRGYTPMGERALSYTRGEEAPPDLRETFAVVKVDGWTESYKAKIDRPDLFAPNVWPGGMPAFRDAWMAYYRAMERLSAVLATVFAAALALPPGWFDDKIDQHVSKLMVASYPAQDFTPKPGQLRAGAHTDFGSWTVVYQDDAPGGLQALTSGGTWIDVPAIADTFVINLGDLMARWTNDRWVSTLHRVVNPGADIAARALRQSLIFFHQPNFDAVIDCIPTCRGLGESALYPPVTSGAHLQLKMRQSAVGAEAE
jgi:isopenicillin N synthase-like dioxygenase